MDIPETLRQLHVELGDRSYPIFIGQGILGHQDLTAHVHGDQIMVVSNEAVAPLYLEQVAGNFPGKQIDHVILPDGELHKNWETLNRIFDQLLERRHTRKTTVVALGGGVVGDMAGFAAASYQRGVPFIQIPTTLLAQVDSSVGGKTGINHPLGKNMIGAFHQPEAVLIDVDTLTTLPQRELPAGLAEVIKYGLIREPAFLSWLEDNIDALNNQAPTALMEAIFRSCRCKADVVAEDEREGGVRATLNLGHTFGHAIETHTGYSSWLHGEAVGVGLMMATELSARLGYLSDQDVERIGVLLQRAGLPRKPPNGMTPDDFRALMAVDKKNVDGALRLVLLEAIGHAVVTQDVTASQLQATLEAFCAP